LLGCALLLEAMPEKKELVTLGETFLDSIWKEIRAMPALREEREFRFTGIAHGWAGVLYSVLMWCRSAAAGLPGDFEERLDQLAEIAVPAKAGIRWERKVRPERFSDPEDFHTSWCNGTGGMIHLWTLAHAMLKNERYLRLAEGSAWNVIDSSDQIDQICCGRPGQVYGILNLFNHTGERRWLDHARQMTEEVLNRVTPAVGQETPPLYFALYKGPIGPALLSMDVENPAQACMPLFESEGWIS